MNNSDIKTLDPRIETHIDAYEECLATHGTAELAEFLPDRSDPQFLRIATELVRVDMELSWDAGNHKSLGDYVEVLPELNKDEDLRTEIAFEEFRQRSHHGQRVTVEEFSRKYDIAPTDWSTVVASGDETRTTDDFDELAQRVPTAGQRWRDFEIIREVGRGALSRVMLAKQTSLSGRQVVLKFAPKHLMEAEKLARLQHPNIVPVFSVYEDRDFHVFCMPYLGSETLGDSKQPFDESMALRLLGQLASAMKHAHDRDILHNDIKPANVLWTAEKQPMLLDFNLAADTTSSRAERAGGTLPYMAPESLVGLEQGTQVCDARSDIFSLGALGFEMVAGQTPFGTEADIRAAVDRRKQLPHFDDLQCSPSFVAILRKCLAFDANQRYQSAGDLAEDVNCQLDNRPLIHAENSSVADRFSKWCRRHPRLSSATSIASVAAVLLAVSLTAYFARGRHVRRLEASSTLTAFQQEANDLIPQLSSVGVELVDTDLSVATAESLLSKYVSESGTWQDSASYRDLPAARQQEVDHEISHLALATAASYATASQEADKLLRAKFWNDVAGRASTVPSKSQMILESKLLHSDGQTEDAKETLSRAIRSEAVSARDLQIAGWLSRVEGRMVESIEMLEQACEKRPRDYSKWLSLAQAYTDTANWREAEKCLTTCLALNRDSALARYSRGACRRELGDHSRAIEDFSEFLDVSPNHPQVLLDRAISYKQLGEHQAALNDLNTAIGAGFDSTRPLLIRSRVRRAMGDRKGAREDERRALAATPRDANGWVARGTAKLAKQPEEALKDFEKALMLHGRSHAARRNIAYVLSERLSKSEQAVNCLTGLIADYPLDDAAYGGRGVLLARQGEFDKAIADAEEIVKLEGGARSMLQAACIYAMASKDRPELRTVSVSLLGSSFKLDPGLVKLAEGDRDLEEIHDDKAFKELCAAAKRLAAVPDAGTVIENTR